MIDPVDNSNDAAVRGGQFFTQGQRRFFGGNVVNIFPLACTYGVDGDDGITAFSEFAIERLDYLQFFTADIRVFLSCPNGSYDFRHVHESSKVNHHGWPISRSSITNNENSRLADSPFRYFLRKPPGAAEIAPPPATKDENSSSQSGSNSISK